MWSLLHTLIVCHHTWSPQQLLAQSTLIIIIGHALINSVVILLSDILTLVLVIQLLCCLSLAPVVFPAREDQNLASVYHVCQSVDVHYVLYEAVLEERESFSLPAVAGVNPSAL